MKKRFNDFKEYSKADQTHYSSMEMEEMANELWSVVMKCFTTVCQFLWKLQEWTICTVRLITVKLHSWLSLNKSIFF